MVPKAGDIVDINPLFKAAMLEKRKKLNISYPDQVEYGVEDDGHIHVARVEKINNEIIVYNSCSGSFRISDSGLRIMDYDLTIYGWIMTEQFFVPVGSSISIIAPRNNDGRSNCFWCHIATQKRGGGIYDVCPTCGR